MAILGPPICLAIVIGFTSNMLYKLNKKAQRKINENKDFVLLDVLHHFTSGVKAYATEA
jgi:hypothetical protein